jgi:hypothetical protein
MVLGVEERIFGTRDRSGMVRVERHKGEPLWLDSGDEPVVEYDDMGGFVVMGESGLCKLRQVCPVAVDAIMRSRYSFVVGVCVVQLNTLLRAKLGMHLDAPYLYSYILL